MILWAILLSLFCMGFSMAEDDIVVQLCNKQGKIRGHVLKSENGKDYYAFQEIPYATPPIGQNRFKEPKEHEGWEGILNTTINKKVCMQNNAIAYTKVPSTMEITEDCLFINVYTPVKPGTKDKALPILFWIHAGGYFYGSGAYQYYDPKYLIDYDIVFVTMNYRLGPFGFLTTEDEVIPGNLGLKDQFLAFEWVIRNIHLFGGDPKSITIAGESAGAVSASYLQLSKKLQGYEGHIRGFIMESGTSLTPIGLQEHARHYAFKMGKALSSKFESSNSKVLRDMLLEASSSDILFANITNDFYTANIISRNVIWVPVIEKKTYSNSIVTVNMHEAYINGDFIRVPLLAGFCSEESKFFVRLTVKEIEVEGSIFDRNVSLIINPSLNVEAKYLKEASTKYKNIYTTGTFQNNPGAFMKYLSGESFVTAGIRTAELVSKFSTSYLYEFAYKGEMGGLSYLTDVPGADNVPHTSELKYIFGGVEGSLGDAKDYPKSDQLTLKRMLILWSNFIKYQNPTPKQDDILRNMIWPPLKAGSIQYLNINRTLEVLSNPKHYNEVKKVFTNYIRPPLKVF